MQKTLPHQGTLRDPSSETPLKRKPRKRFGFTLAELLVSLLILGEIATFTIPKILSSQQEQRKKAVFKETISTLSVFLNNGIFSNTLNNSTSELSMRQALPQNLNFATIVDLGIYSSSGVPNACWGSSIQGIRGWYGLMHNGACVAPSGPLLDGSGKQTFIMAIDYNGPDGPNTFGQDWLAVCMGIDNYAGGAWCSSLRKGEIKPMLGQYGNSQPLWDSIWQ